MGNLVKGKNMVTAMWDGSAYIPIFCAKSGEFVMDQDEIEVTYINSGSYKDFIPGLNSGTFSASGITELDNSGGHISLAYLLQTAIRRQIQQLRTMLTDDDGNVMTLSYNGFVTNTTLSKQTGSYSQSAVTFRITGGIAFGGAPTPPTPGECELMPTLYLTLAESAISVNSALLQVTGVDIVSVSREGTILTYVAGTPGNLEFSHDLPAGDILFPPGNPGNPGGEHIAIEYQILSP